MTEQELRLYIDVRRREVADRRRHAAQQTSEWAADGAIHELDRLEGWLSLQLRGRWDSGYRTRSWRPVGRWWTAGEHITVRRRWRPSGDRE